MSQFLFFGISGRHSCVLPSTSGLQLRHCRFVLDKGLRCTYPEAMAGYARHVYLGFAGHVLDHISRGGNTERGISHFAVLVYSPEQRPYTHAGKPLVSFDCLHCPLLEIDFSPFGFLVGL